MFAKLRDSATFTSYGPLNMLEMWILTHWAVFDLRMQLAE